MRALEITKFNHNALQMYKLRSREVKWFCPRSRCSSMTATGLEPRTPETASLQFYHSTKLVHDKLQICMLKDLKLKDNFRIIFYIYPGHKNFQIFPNFKICGVIALQWHMAACVCTGAHTHIHTHTNLYYVSKTCWGIFGRVTYMLVWILRKGYFRVDQFTPGICSSKIHGFSLEITNYIDLYTL